MKIFIPMPDEPGQKLYGHLVPFNADFLDANHEAREGRMPRNWLSDTDYTSACERLQLNHRNEALATT